MIYFSGEAAGVVRHHYFVCFMYYSSYGDLNLFTQYGDVFFYWGGGLPITEIIKNFDEDIFVKVKFRNV